MPLDMTDDGSLIVGNDGGTILFAAIQAMIWVNGAPQDPLVYYTSLGMAPTGFTELGNITAITNDGSALCGVGVNGGAGHAGGWVIVFPDELPNGTPFCSGDGSGTACPCANAGGPDRGCASSSAPLGAKLSGTGVSSVTPASDSLVLTASDVAGPGLFFQGSAQMAGGSGVTFGDGLLCAGGTILRMGVVFPTAGSASYPGGLTPNPIHVAGGPLVAGDVRHYQCWYRDAAAFCSAATYNLTQGLTVTWTP
jgi:hypothetical protein